MRMKLDGVKYVTLMGDIRRMSFLWGIANDSEEFLRACSRFVDDIRDCMKPRDAMSMTVELNDLIDCDDVFERNGFEFLRRAFYVTRIYYKMDNE